jgi:hypothetical protein
MPLIEIDALEQPSTVDLERVTRELNRAVAAAIPCRLDAVWTVWRTVAGPYVRGEETARVQPADTHAPIAHVYLHRTAVETARAVEAIERVLERELSLAPGNVFVTVQPVELVERGG